MMRFVAVMLAVGACATATSLSAHHSFPGTYIENRTVTIEGELAQIVFRNPHSFVQVVVQERGSRVRYDVEWVGAGELTRDGITPTTLKQGDRVVISGLPAATPGDRRVRMTSLRRVKDGLDWKLPPGRRMSTGYGS
jgi:hypothetical protein